VVITSQQADHLGSPRFRALFQSALKSYEEKAGVKLANHPLVLQLQNCHTVESIAAVLQGQALVPSDFPGSDRVMMSIQGTVSILTRLSATAPLAVDIDLVRQQPLAMCSTALTVFTAIPNRESNTRLSCYITCCMYHSLRACVAVLVISKRTRQPRASLPAIMHSSTCSSLSNIFSVVSIYTHGSLPRPQWTGWWPR